MGLFKTFSNIRRKIWDYFSCDLEYNFVNWQRLSIYLCLVLIISALFLLQYVGWMGERWMFLLPFRIFINVLFTGTFIAFLFRKILLSTALSVSIGLCVVFNIIVMVSLVHDAPDFYLQAIVSSMVMLTIMLFFAICAYLRGLSYVIALSTVLAYGYCCLKSGCPLLNNLFGILAMIITIVTILGNRLIILLKHLTTVNREIKNTHQTILSLSNMTKSDMLCLLQLAGKNDLMSLQTDKLMELIGKETQQDVRQDAEEWYRQLQNRQDPLRMACPTLSPMQYEICQLIIAGKKVSEIAYLMNKAPSNITCQRTKIRAELKLQKGDNLRETLLEIVKKGTT